MTKTSSKLATVLALALGTASVQAQWTYIDVQDGFNFPGAGTAVDATTDSDATWGLGDDGGTYGWRFRNTGPGAPAYNGTAYTGRWPGQAAGAPDPALYIPVSGLLADTDYIVRVYAVFPQNSTNLPIAGSRQGAEFSINGGLNWQDMDNHGSSLNWVDNATELGNPLPTVNAGDTRAWHLLVGFLHTDALGNARIDMRLPQFLQDGTAQDRFNIDGFALAVPEPSTFALFGLGSAALLIFRRRR